VRQKGGLPGDPRYGTATVGKLGIRRRERTCSLKKQCWDRMLPSKGLCVGTGAKLFTPLCVNGAHCVLIALYLEGGAYALELSSLFTTLCIKKALRSLRILVPSPHVRPADGASRPSACLLVVSSTVDQART